MEEEKIDKVDKVKGLSVVKGDRFLINFELSEPSVPVGAEVDGIDLDNVLNVKGDEKGTKINFDGLVSCHVEKKEKLEILKCRRKRVFVPMEKFKEEVEVE
jgi:hypothetical protein